MELAEVVTDAVQRPFGVAFDLAAQQQSDQSLVFDLTEDRFHLSR
jgi:hypothetical protein